MWLWFLWLFSFCKIVNSIDNLLWTSRLNKDQARSDQAKLVIASLICVFICNFSSENDEKKFLNCFCNRKQKTGDCHQSHNDRWGSAQWCSNLIICLSYNFFVVKKKTTEKTEKLMLRRSYKPHVQQDVKSNPLPTLFYTEAQKSGSYLCWRRRCHIYRNVDVIRRHNSTDSDVFGAMLFHDAASCLCCCFFVLYSLAVYSSGAVLATYYMLHCDF